MNWLAHLLLSEPETPHRLGNLLADLVKGSARRSLPADLQRGLACHRVIDSFTDAHPVVHRSQRRIGPPFERFAGVLIDVFYDHYLARGWQRYGVGALNDFTSEVYTALLGYVGEIPEKARWVIGRMASEDWLGSYREPSGVAATLQRLSLRLERPGLLLPAVDEMLRHDAALDADFQEFFPQLAAHVAAWENDVHSVANVIRS
ncbi:MAG: DUF479 domain-containing protein [Planctomycetia bacterium]|nr:DUF479 domain-containing protein [Planctomycetia bacterium]